MLTRMSRRMVPRACCELSSVKMGNTDAGKCNIGISWDLVTFLIGDLIDIGQHPHIHTQKINPRTHRKF